MAAKHAYTPYQRKIIAEYYRTAESRGLANLQEIVTELYLTTSEKKRRQLWERARKALVAVGMKPRLIEHIISTKKPEVLAAHVKDMF
jgi:hypothetical protein